MSHIMDVQGATTQEMLKQQRELAKIEAGITIEKLKIEADITIEKLKVDADIEKLKIEADKELKKAELKKAELKIEADKAIELKKIELEIKKLDEISCESCMGIVHPHFYDLLSHGCRDMASGHSPTIHCHTPKERLTCAPLLTLFIRGVDDD